MLRPRNGSLTAIHNTNETLIMDKLQQLKKTASFCTPKAVCYLLGKDADDFVVGEIHPGSSLCPECAQKKADKINGKIASLLGDLPALHDYLLSLDCNADDEEIKEIRHVYSVEESCPEYDGFCYCNECGALLDADNLLTFPEEEINCYIKMNDKELDNLSPVQAREIVTIMDMYIDPDNTEAFQLREELKKRLLKWFQE